MAWSVVWSKAATSRLAQVWIDSPDRVALTERIRWAESQLKHRPYPATKELKEGLRTIDAAEARLYIEIDEPRNAVYVRTVGQITPRG